MPQINNLIYLQLLNRIHGCPLNCNCTDKFTQRYRISLYSHTGFVRFTSQHWDVAVAFLLSVLVLRSSTANSCMTVSKKDYFWQFINEF